MNGVFYKPIYPVVAWESSQDNAGTEGASWVETATGEVDSSKFSDEKRQANADRCKEGSFVFFSSQHENGEDEHGSQEHLDEQSSDDRSATTEGCRDIHGGREKA